MKKFNGILIVLLLFSFIPALAIFGFGPESPPSLTLSLLDSIYCRYGGTCFFTNLTVINMTVLNIFNVTDTICLHEDCIQNWTNGSNSLDQYFVKKSGDNMTGDLDMNDNNILNINNLTINGQINSNPIYGELWIEATKNLANYTSIIFGTSFIGDANNLKKIDNNYTIIQEQVKDPAFQQIYNFTDVSNTPGRFDFVGYYYPCSASHDVKVYFWNYINNTWVPATSNEKDILCYSDDNNVEYSFQYPLNSSEYISDGKVSVLISHDNNGNTAHYLGTDYVEVESKDLTFLQAGVYYQAGNGMEGLSNEIILNSTFATMEIIYNGIYKVCVQQSFSGSNDLTVHSDIFKNDIEIDKVAFTRKLGSSGDVGSAGICGLLNLTSGDILSLKYNGDKKGWIHFINGNFNIHRII